MRKIVALILSFVFISLFVIPVHAIEFPKYVGYVNDFENILNNDKELEDKLVQLEKDTSVEIAIVTVPDFAGTTIEDYGVKLFENWKIGKKDKDNGLLILVSSKEKQSRFEVGYGLEGTLPDSLTGRIQDIYMIPNFQTGDYSKGIADGLDATIGIIKNDPTVITSLSASTTSQSSISINERVVFAMFFIFYILSFSKSWWMGGIVGFLLGLYISIGTSSVLDIFYLPSLFAIFGLILDFLVSKTFIGTILRTSNNRRVGGGGGFGGSTGGMSFGGGSSGGGGSSRSW